MTLKSFPRGAAVQETKRLRPLVKKNSKTDKRKRVKGEEGDDSSAEEATLICKNAEKLTYKTIPEGLIVLGCIFDVTEYDLMVSLPGGLIGRVQIIDISDFYTNLLHGLIKSEDTQISEFKRLPELYSVGDYVVCYVKNIQPQEKWQISLSLDPKLINQNVDINCLDSGSKVVCTVSSIEDHGCIVDTGLPNLRAFIPTKENNNKSRFFPGKQLLCFVEEIQSCENISTIKLSTQEKYIKAIHDIEIDSLDSLVPGTKFNLYIKKILSNGLLVSFGGDNIGYINQIYLSEPLSNYSVGLTVIGTLLYILPTVKYAYFSLTLYKPRDNAVKFGDIIEEATVLFKEYGGVVLQLTKNGTRGILPFKKTNIDFDKIVEKFVPGSKHKCRILSYSWIDKTYICTMQYSILQQRYFSLTDFKVGDISTVKITHIDEQRGFIKVQVGKINGLVTPVHVSDEGSSGIRKLNVGKEVEARVLAVHPERNSVYFTLKKSLISSSLPILSDITDAKPGSQYHGTIVHIQKMGILITFFGDVKGWTPHSNVEDTSSAKWNFFVGQTVLTKIESVEADSGKLILSLRTNEKKSAEVPFVIGDKVEGIIVETSTQGVYLRISKNNGEDFSTGFLPAGHMSPCTETAALLASRSIPGETLTALVFAIVPDLILTRTFVPQGRYKKFDKLKVGDCIPCSVRDLEPNGVRVILPIEGCTPYEYISYSNITNYNMLHANQILFAKIAAINKKEKRLKLTLSLKKIHDDLTTPESRINIAVDVLSLHFNKLKELAKYAFYENRPISMVQIGQRVSGKIQNVTADGLVVQLQNNLMGTVPNDHYVGDKKIGDKISGTVIWKNYVHEFVELTALPSVMHKISAKQNKQLEFPKDKLLRGRILLVNSWFIIILLKGIGKGILAAMPSRRHMNDLKPDLTPYNVHSRIRCFIRVNFKDSDVMPICMVKSAFENKYCVKTKPLKNALNVKVEVEEGVKAPAKKVKKTEDTSKLKVTEKNSDMKINGQCIKDNANCVQTKPLKNVSKIKVEIEEDIKAPAKKVKKAEGTPKLKVTENNSEVKINGQSIKNKTDCVQTKPLKNVLKRKTETEEGIKAPVKKAKKADGTLKIEVTKKNSGTKISDQCIKDKNDMKLKVVKQEDVELSTIPLMKEVKENEKKPRIEECGFFWDDKPDLTLLDRKESSSDSEDEVVQESQQKKKKLSAAERREQERHKEQQIRQREEALASNQLPNSVDQFDRLVLASPNSSIIWLQYMAYHLQTTEIEKARAVARRAVKTINFREENEKLNVWNAWLNLESKFGTPESLNDVFQEAVRTNDSIKIYNHMLTIHIEANRQIELEKTINIMTGRFKQNPQVWIDCGAAFLRMGLKEKSRHIMHRAIQSLPTSEHVNLMTRFAILESKFGDKERAQTLFEQILSSYPKRVDIWSCYVDSIIKSNDIDIARNVLERAVVQTLPPRKMKTLFKKFINFEEQYGTQENVARVQQMAAEYVEKQCNRDA